MMGRFLIGIGLLLSLLLSGCGGGGAPGGGSTISLFGRVVWIETGSHPDPVATVRSGSASTTTSTVDGSFQVQPAPGATSITVTWSASGGGTPIVRTFTFAAKTTNTDLGDIYIGPEVVSVQGRAVNSTDQSPIPGALVKMAGVETVTAGDGSFSLDGVAYSSSSLAVFLGLQGSISKTGFFTRFFSPPSGATNGVVEVGDIEVTPEGTSDPPPPPFNISGKVLPVGDGAGAEVVLKSGGVTIRTTTADGSASFRFWAPVGSYSIEASNGAKSGSAAVTVTKVNETVKQDVTIN